MSLLRQIFSLLLCSCIVCEAYAQQGKDTIQKNRTRAGKFLHNVFDDAMNSIRRTPGDTTTGMQNVLVTKSELSFLRFEGKIIRFIEVRHFGFERTFTDTTNRINYIGTRLLNSLHTDTREWVIRQNLFLNENVPLNASKLADNERYLRTLEFIQDARIFVYPIPGTSDSVDVLVITKDLFSLTGALDFNGVNSVKARLAEANFMGMAQRIQGTVLWEEKRSPRTGYELLYSKTNIGGSFVNGTVAYTRINSGRSDGTEEENAFYLRLERPLVSPFSHIAGGLEVSFNRSDNVYQKPDSLFYRYGYNVYDVWAGYNIGTRHLLEGISYTGNRTRTFFSLRYLQASFTERPSQITDQYDPIYNDKLGVLAQLSLFRQDFYKLNYIYGFGTTEDVPMGFNLSLTGGWYRQQGLERPYLGIQAQQYIVTTKGGFIDAVFKAGGFYRGNDFEDASTLAAVNVYTRLFPVGRWKLREHLKVSFTQLKSRITSEPLRLNNTYGLYEFSTPQVEGEQRISMFAESILYTNKKIFGFRFAPFLSGGFTLMKPEHLPFKKADIYSGVAGGIRTRNENLVFGTIELQGIFFPRTIDGIDQFTIKLTTDLRFRYRTNFVNAPDFVQLNRENL